MRNRYSDDDRRKALVALKASIKTSKTGRPDFMGTARATRISHTKLRTWWREEHAPPAESPEKRRAALTVITPETPAPDAADIFDLDEVTFLKHLAMETRQTGAAAHRGESYVAAMAALKAQRELYGEYQSAKKRALDASGLDEAAFLERLEEEAQEMPDQHLEVYMKEYLDRHNLSLKGRTGTEG